MPRTPWARSPPWAPAAPAPGSGEARVRRDGCQGFPRVSGDNTKESPPLTKLGGSLLLEVTALGWTLTIGVIVALLALDLTLGVLRPHAVGFREAALWS